MRYYKTIADGYLVMISENTGGEEITEAEYNSLLSIIHAAPTAPDGYQYRLRADTLEWELVELPPVEPEDDEATAEDYEAALREVGVVL